MCSFVDQVNILPRMGMVVVVIMLNILKQINIATDIALPWKLNLSEVTRKHRFLAFLAFFCVNGNLRPTTCSLLTRTIYFKAKLLHLSVILRVLALRMRLTAH